MLHLHSFLRYAVLLLLLVAVIQSITGWMNKRAYRSGDDKTSLFLMISAHLQLVIGFILYFTQGWASAPFAESMKNAISRYWKIEHLSMMLIGIVLITVGRMVAKRKQNDLAKFRISAIFYTLALIIILYGIPWSQRGLF